MSKTRLSLYVCKFDEEIDPSEANRVPTLQVV